MTEPILSRFDFAFRKSFKKVLTAYLIFGGSSYKVEFVYHIQKRHRSLRMCLLNENNNRKTADLGAVFKGELDNFVSTLKETAKKLEKQDNLKPHYYKIKVNNYIFALDYVLDHPYIGDYGTGLIELKLHTIDKNGSLGPCRARLGLYAVSSICSELKGLSDLNGENIWLSLQHAPRIDNQYHTLFGIEEELGVGTYDVDETGFNPNIPF